MAKEYIFKLDYALYNEETGEAVFKPKVVCELVRCGECKYYSKYRCPNDMMLWTHICALGCGTCGEDWFCADGERKENEDGTN